MVQQSAAGRSTKQLGAPPPELAGGASLSVAALVGDAAGRLLVAEAALGG